MLRLPRGGILEERTKFITDYQARALYRIFIEFSRIKMGPRVSMEVEWFGLESRDSWNRIATRFNYHNWPIDDELDVKDGEQEPGGTRWRVQRRMWPIYRVPNSPEIGMKNVIEIRWWTKWWATDMKKVYSLIVVGKLVGWLTMPFIIFDCANNMWNFYQQRQTGQQTDRLILVGRVGCLSCQLQGNAWNCC